MLIQSECQAPMFKITKIQRNLSILLILYICVHTFIIPNGSDRLSLRLLGQLGLGVTLRRLH